MNEGAYSDLLGKLREALVLFKPGHPIYEQTVAPRDTVFARYRPVFSCETVRSISKEDFTSFLYLENNLHWSGLYRKGLGAAADMGKLRTALSILVDESRPIRDRLTEAVSMVSGFGKGTATAILTVTYPTRYGVWNNTSEAALMQAGVWPKFERGDGIGGRYEKVNEILARLATDLGVDFWTLDALWWSQLEGTGPFPPPPVNPDNDSNVRAAGATSFALERQIEDFLLENWDRTPLATDWRIYSTPDEPEAGNQFPTSIGRIDILAIHKSEPRYLVIELKRNQSSDQTVGQALRYLGWVKKHLATSGQSVEALIIAHTIGTDLQYAVSTIPSVSAMTYAIEFRLSPLAPLA
ncbi:MAG: hypothetical protein AMXMBFR64_58050 [Myxococcales bacterium]